VDKNKTQLIVMILLFGLGIGGYQIYIFRTEDVPRMEQELAKLEADVANKQAELKKLQNFAQNIEKIKQELRELNLQLESALEYMPRALNLSGLLRRLTMVAQNSGVELHTFRPRKNEEKAPGSFYSTIAIEFDLKGTFAQTLVFLDQLSRLKRIVNIEGLRLRPENTQRLGSTLAVTTGTMKTYRFSE